MAFDGILMHQLMIELQNKLLGGRIDKIHQPEKDELTIQIRGIGNNYNLFVSIESSMPYFTLTQSKKENPSIPPMFCMLLRKHLVGGRILSIEQHENERVAIFRIECRNELGDLEVKNLIIEIMGKHSNVILTHESDIIIDSIKRVTPDLSRVRTLLPGIMYTFLPTDKVSIEKNADDLWQQVPYETPVFKALYAVYQGMSPLSSKYVLRKANIAYDIPRGELTESQLKALLESLNALYNSMNSKTPMGYVYKCLDLKNTFYFLKDLYPTCEQLPFDSLSEAIDYYFNQTNKDLKIHQRTLHLKKTLAQRIERYQNKLGKLKSEIETAQNSDMLRIQGELLLAHLHEIDKGQNSITLENYYLDPPEPITIPMDVRLDPSQNAQLYFKKYNKAKTAVIQLQKQIEEAELDCVYLENTLTHLENSDDAHTIDEIREELMEQGIIKNRVSKKKKKTKPSQNYRTFIATEGESILVGKNNHQNDTLTLKLASKKDIWLHTKIIPGSHVIIRTEGNTPSEATIMEAAEIAAYFSKARASGNVPVDYTAVKNVSKPSGAKPGMVIYTHHHTIYVTPDPDKIKQMEIK